MYRIATPAETQQFGLIEFRLLKPVLKPTPRTRDEVNSVLAMRLGSVLRRLVMHVPFSDSWNEQFANPETTTA